ncbi:glyoxalase [Streptomyces sp. NPDC021020]|uniref:glyoxalase n=1 Tax=Streptomyces sp. NPDC021020 TaxID=3365109 RepID=UPI00378EDAEB
MNSIEAVILDAADPAAAERFYERAFGLGDLVRVRAADAEAGSGFRGYTLSLVVAQPSIVRGLVGSAVDAGASEVKPVTKSLWGYGGVVKAPDGALWKIATSAKKDTAPDSRKVDEVVLLLGATDVLATKRFYVEQGLTVGKSFGRKYVEFAAPGSIKLALYGRRALAKDAGVPEEGEGPHGLAIAASGTSAFTDPDGFAWQPAS